MKEFEYDAEQNKNEQYVKKGFWRKAKEISAKVPFVLDSVTMYYCSIDQKTPLWVKGVAFGALAYLINPVDAIPDAIPVLGFSDDAGAIAASLTAIGSHVTDEHKEQAHEAMLGE